MLQPNQLALYSFANYSFSTQEEGRVTSLYFEDMLGNQGRWRREHPGGPLLVYQGKSRRLFVSPTELRNYRSDTEASLHQQDATPFGHRANGDYQVLRAGKSITGISLTASAGWHVLELCPPLYYARHGSSGRVTLTDPTAGAADYATVQTIAATSDWS